MSKTQKSSSAPGSKPAPSRQYHDRNLVKTDPKKEQFAPTEVNAVRQHKRMAGEA